MDATIAFNIRLRILTLRFLDDLKNEGFTTLDEVITREQTLLREVFQEWWKPVFDTFSCEICGKSFYDFDDLNKFEVVLAYYKHDVLAGHCSTRCADKWERQDNLKKQQRQEEWQWIKKSRKNLKEVRQYLRNNPGVSPMPDTASKPVTISPI